MLHLGQELANSRSHDGKHLKEDNMGQNDHNGHHDEEGLGEELDETATSLPVEGPPGIQEANDAGTAHHLADNLAAESAVKRNNGVLVLWEDGSFDADKSDHGGEAKENGAGNSENGNSSETGNETHPLRTGGDVLVVQLVKTEEHANASGQIQADVWHDGCDSGRDRERLPVAL